MATAYVNEITDRFPNPADPTNQSVIVLLVNYWGLAQGTAQESIEVVVANTDSKTQQKAKINAAILARLDSLGAPTTHNARDILTLSDIAG